MGIILENDFIKIYKGFQSPIVELDCGYKCAPYNEYGVPFCCDTRHAVPTAYQPEWEYLKRNTNIWHLFKGQSKNVSQQDLNRLEAELPLGQVLIECLGHTRCQRNYRSITCRAFPFFPYLQSDGEFIGLSYYWEYRDRCWIINNLEVVSPDYLNQFFITYERIFDALTQERENFQYHAEHVRREYIKLRRHIILLHRNGYIYKINPSNEKMIQISFQVLPKFGLYKISSVLKFPDE